MTKCLGPHHDLDDLDDLDDFHDFTTCDRSRNSFLHCKSSFYIDFKSWSRESRQVVSRDVVPNTWSYLIITISWISSHYR